MQEISEVHGRFGKVIFKDCLEGLKQLPDKSFDLGLTDPPWLVNYNKKDMAHHGRNLGYENKIHYKEDYDYDWARAWFSELERICKGICLIIGSMIFLKWIKEIPSEPIGIFNRYYTNGQGGTKLAFASGYTPYIFYGELNRRLNFDIYYRPKQWGFLNNDRKILKHPTPRDEVVLMKVIKETKSESVLDPFAGAGTTAVACEILGLNYLCFEIIEDYAEIIKYRINEGIKLHKQLNKRIKKLGDY